MGIRTQGQCVSDVQVDPHPVENGNAPMGQRASREDAEGAVITAGYGAEHGWQVLPLFCGARIFSCTTRMVLTAEGWSLHILSERPFVQL